MLFFIVKNIYNLKLKTKEKKAILHLMLERESASMLLLALY